jgi:uncharacterized MAPEG superfamily protein
MPSILLAIPVAYGLVFLPKFVIARSALQQPEGYNNKNPRDQQAALAGAGKRAVAAHQNGFEAFAPFAAGVLIAYVSGARPQLAAGLVVAHLLSRTLYPFLYIADSASMRSLVWGVGALSAVALMCLPAFG